jgi:hypothetical protein
VFQKFLGDRQSSGSTCFWECKNLRRTRPLIRWTESVINKDRLNHLRMKYCLFIFDLGLFLLVSLSLILIHSFYDIMLSLLEEILLVVNEPLAIYNDWLIHEMSDSISSFLIHASAIMIMLKNEAYIVLYWQPSMPESFNSHWEPSAVLKLDINAKFLMFSFNRHHFITLLMYLKQLLMNHMK